MNKLVILVPLNCTSALMILCKINRYVGYISVYLFFIPNKHLFFITLQSEKNLGNNTLASFPRFLPAKGVMPAAGLEPARGYPQQILSLHRLPFRHAGLPSQRYLFYHMVFVFASNFRNSFPNKFCSDAGIKRPH